MTYSVSNKIHHIIEEDMSFSDDFENIINTLETEGDAEIGNYRYIHEDTIDEIMESEMESDAYVLGSMNSSFLAGVTNWPVSLIEAGQKGEQYDDIGQALIDGNHVKQIVKDFVRYDGYGYHFAHYDHNEESLEGGWYKFRVN